MIDLKQTESGDIDLSSGVQVVESTNQHKYDILKASQGDFKQSPLVGVGLIRYINSEDGDMMLRDISRQMQQDGMRVDEVRFENGDLIINGKYKEDENN